MTAEQTKRFKYWQWRTIIGTMIGYAIFFSFARTSLFAIPGLTAEYGISKTTFGVIMTLVGLILRRVEIRQRRTGGPHQRPLAHGDGPVGSSVINIHFGCACDHHAHGLRADLRTTFIHTLVVLFGVLLILNNMFQGCGFRRATA